MDETELQEKIAELREKRKTNQDNYSFEPYDSLHTMTAQVERKDDGVFGVFTFQCIIVVFIGILYILATTFFPKEVGDTAQTLKTIMTNDFSFKGAIYQTVGDLITELNKATPVDVKEQNNSELNGIGGEKPNETGSLLPKNATLADVIYTGSITFPIANGRNTSEFGFRKSPETKQTEFHNAVDLASENGADIYSVADGKVIASDFDKYLGNYIKIDHGNGFVTKYGHCSKLLATVGTVVREGEVIAYVGSTGDSTGPHVHFAAQKNGVYFNPLYLYTYNETQSSKVTGLNVDL